MPWILGQGWTSSDDHRQRAIPLVGRWKMIDNLRRSLSAPAGILALLVGWSLPFTSAALWSAFIVTTIAIPALLPFLTGILPRRLGLSQRIHLRAVGADLALALSQTLLLVMFLAHQAWAMSDAILKTLFRLASSRRNLLEWLTDAQAKLSPRLDLGGFYRQMAGSVAIGDLRRGNGARATVLKPELLERLRVRLDQPPPDGGRWCSGKVARWMAQELGLEKLAPQRGWEALKALGWSIQKPRPRNPKAATQAEQEEFKNVWPAPSARAFFERADDQSASTYPASAACRPAKMEIRAFQAS